MSNAKRRRHIAVLTTSYPADDADPSGHFVASEVRRLVEAGERVTVLCAGPAPLVPVDGAEHISLGGGSTFAWPGVLSQLKQAPWRVLDVLRFARRARAALSNSDYDELIAHWLLPCAWPLAGPFRGPLDVVIHGTDARLFQTLPRSVQRRILNQFEARKATLRFVASALLNCFAEHSDHPAMRRTRIEPCCLELGKVPSRDAARNALGLKATQFVAVVVGRLIRQKRIHLALQLHAQQLGTRTAQESDTLRVVIGDGPLRHTLERSFPETRFLGRLPRSQALLWIRAADVLISASEAEGAPTCIREARALGTRVLSSPVGDVPRWAMTDRGIELLWVRATQGNIKPAIEA